MGIRTVAEVKDLIEGEPAIREEVPRLRKLAPPGLSDEKIAFCVAASEDEMSDADWKKALALCQDKTEEEIVRIMYKMTSHDSEVEA